MIEKQRDQAVDIMKGILVLQMILCHCIQFFGNEARPVQKQICDYANLVSFSGFLFTFGLSCWYAYFQKTFRQVWSRMLTTAAKCLIAFYLSSICYIGLVEYDYYDPRVFSDLLLLKKYGGWSEFLASFAVLLLLAMAGYALFQKINLPLLAGAGILGIAVSCLPHLGYETSYAALLVGSYGYNTFPVLPYLFYFAAGVYFCKNRQKKLPYGLIFLLAALFSLPAIVFYVQNQILPERFPPDYRFILGASLFVFGYYWISGKLSMYAKGKRILGGIAEILSGIGQNVLFYLLLSNIVIFAFSESNFKLRTFPFVLKFYVVLMLGLWYLHRLVYKGRPALLFDLSTEGVGKQE